MHSKSRITDQLAKIIRIGTIPPVLITILLLYFYFDNPILFHNGADVLIMIGTLGVIPALAYPIQLLWQGKGESKRDTQRKVAFLCTLIGYSLSFIWALVANTLLGEKLICSTYFFSVVILSLCNLLHFKASGHACGITGPLVFLVFFNGILYVIPCLIIGGFIAWSSVHLKRHTLFQFVCGSLVCIFSFLLTLILFFQ